MKLSATDIKELLADGRAIETTRYELHYRGNGLLDLYEVIDIKKPISAPRYIRTREDSRRFMMALLWAFKVMDQNGKKYGIVLMRHYIFHETFAETSEYYGYASTWAYKRVAKAYEEMAKVFMIDDE